MVEEGRRDSKVIAMIDRDPCAEVEDRNLYLLEICRRQMLITGFVCRMLTWYEP